MKKMFALVVFLLLNQPTKADDEFKIPSGEEKPKASFKKLASNDKYDWGVKRLGIPTLHTKGITGKGIKFAVIDTGVDSNHPDLKTALKGGKDFTGSPVGWTDRNSHGTHTFGTIGANGELVGCAPEGEGYALKALGDNGSGRMDWCAAAIMYAVDDLQVNVISMSLGAPQADETTRKACAYAVSKGVVVVAAAGNEGPRANTVGAPGGYLECVCVGACDANDSLASFSSRGSRLSDPFIVAPGVDIGSTIPGGRYGSYDGTSMATPHVAGCAILWMQAKGLKIDAAKRNDEFRKDLIASANFKTRDSNRGYGLFDAVKLCGTEFNPVPPNPTPQPSSFTLSEKDLTQEAYARLKGAKFELTISIPPGTTPNGVNTSSPLTARLPDTSPPSPVQVSPVRDYSAAVKAVERGETVYLSVGDVPQSGDYSITSLNGFASGRYRCFLENGVAKMQALRFTSCPNGQCPPQTVYRR